MGIYIPGIETPKGHNYVTITIWPSGTASYGLFNREENLCDFKSIKAVPVPPHGRLIDADALDTSILQAGFSYAITRRKLRYTPGDVRQKIANAPTIIQKEEGE